MVYKFRADMYGTSWYHSHYSAQYAGGALGPIVIHGPKTAEYDDDLGPVLLADWYHQDYFSLVNETMSGGVPASDNNLINGKNNYPCANSKSAFNAKSRTNDSLIDCSYICMHTKCRTFQVQISIRQEVSPSPYQYICRGYSEIYHVRNPILYSTYQISILLPMYSSQSHCD
jgi:FtsP/CotA-like multicopper oxidase with cupredoxin domain